ncbi:MAG: hypothetical protein HY737_00215 [Candidatus Omnitrophica bacterium]|nr:hypothetical protein [Candidatus Omnitrophota bacterium]
MIFAFVLLAVIALCAMILTATILLTATDMRRALRRVTSILPEAEEALKKTNRSLSHVQRILGRANVATQRVDHVVAQACDAASEALQRVTQLKTHVSGFFQEHAGNGARGEPRHRRGK